MSLHSGIIVFLAICASIAPSFPKDSIEKIQYRLPKDTMPISYGIHISIFTEGFHGTVAITLKIINNTNDIVLHINNLSIKHIIFSGDAEVDIEEIMYNDENQFLTIHFNSTLKEGNVYGLTIEYDGHYNKGFFTSYYEGLAHEYKSMVTTNLKPTNARSVFPCYDEPAFKAKFTVWLTHYKFYTALSNMPQNEIEQGGNLVTTKFKESPLMSTYNVAFLLTPHQHISVKEGDVTYRVFSPPIAKSNGDNTLQMITKITHYFEEHFDIKYPLPKMDHITIPAMSIPGVGNWGLLVYQFGYLLPTSDNSYLYNITTNSVIAHKIAEQWIGNLVTPKWWSYNWLNEGLAKFYAGKVMQFIYPQWDTAETELFMEGAQIVRYQFETEHFMKNDHIIKAEEKWPLSRNVETREEINDLFRKYTNFKGAYLFRIFEHALTKKTFQKGIIQYLKGHQYSVVDEDDLFNSLQAAATEDKIKYFEEPGQVAKVMRTWTSQWDFPFITVTRNYEHGTFKIVDNPEVMANRFLWIPITYATASSPNFEDTSTDFIFPEEKAIEPNASGITLNEDDWLILNKKGIGHYSVSYDEKNWDLIIQTLKTNPKKIHVLNRALLIRDAWKFVHTNIRPDKYLLDLLSYLKNEDEPLPWYEATYVLRKMVTSSRRQNAQYMSTPFKKSEIQELVRDIISNIYTKIGIHHIPLEQPLWEKVRPNLLFLACDYELVDCKSLLEEKYWKLLSWQRRHNSGT